MNLWVIFLTGLTVGGLTCLAVQGGLLASVIASRESDEIDKNTNKRNDLWPTLAFLGSKLAAYLVLGFLLGAFGQVLSISDSTQTTVQFLAGIYMIVVALNLLNIHPIFRYAIIQPPRFLMKLVRNQSRSKDLFAPSLLGVMTVFIPCGTTLAMEALAISSGNAFSGAAIMGAFVLGTMPLFFGVGFITTFLGDNFRTKFLKFAAVLVLYLGIASINGSLNAWGSPVTLQSMAELSPVQFNFSEESRKAALEKRDAKVAPKSGAQESNLVSGIQVLEMTVKPDGYSPNYFQVKAGTPVKLNLNTTGQLGCSSAFRIPKLGISKRLTANSTESIEFTPEKAGKIPFTCAMGMYTGVIEVI